MENLSALVALRCCLRVTCEEGRTMTSLNRCLGSNCWKPPRFNLQYLMLCWFISSAITKMTFISYCHCPVLFDKHGHFPQHVHRTGASIWTETVVWREPGQVLILLGVSAQCCCQCGLSWPAFCRLSSSLHSWYINSNIYSLEVELNMNIIIIINKLPKRGWNPNLNMRTRETIYSFIHLPSSY